MEINNDCANTLGIVNMNMSDTLSSGVYYDLCPNCMGDLVSWMKLNKDDVND